MKAIAAALILASLAGSAAAAAPMTLNRPPPLARKNESLPRITAPATPASTKINAALARIDARWRAYMRECRDSAAGQDNNGYTERRITVTMTGPKVLSLTVDEEIYCGGAHPDTAVMALAYDLDTGRPLDWTRLLPARLVDEAALDNDEAGTRIGVVRSTVLHGLYFKAVSATSHGDADWRQSCEEALSAEDLAFQLWVDARAGGVALAPSGLPHVIAACADPVVIPTATLRPLGVEAALLDAIDAAHRGR